MDDVGGDDDIIGCNMAIWRWKESGSGSGREGGREVMASAMFKTKG